MRQSRAFTLIELLIGVVLSLIVVGGVTYAFSRINEGVRNASRSTDITNNIRGLFQIMQSDFYQASRGVSDLNHYQIHVNNPNAASEQHFFGVTEMDADSGNSEVVLQYFDYDMENGGGNPSFPAVWDGASAGAWPDTVPALVLMSAVPNDSALAEVAAGDYFVIYRSDVLYETEINDLVAAVGADGLYNEDDVAAGGLGNGAFLLQVAGVEASSVTGPACGDPSGDYQSAIRVSWGGSDFANDFASNPVLTDYSVAGGCPGDVMQADESGVEKTAVIKPPGGTWMARKVAADSGYHRVTYSVTNQTLVRTENGVDMIMASNIDSFEVEVGVDIVPNGTDQWNGSVSTLDSAYWFDDMDDLGSNRTAARAFLGRHALAVRLKVTLESLRGDDSDTTAGGTGNTKTRSLSHQFKLKNQHLPLRNQ